MKKQFVILTICLLTTVFYAFGQNESDRLIQTQKPGSSESSYANLMGKTALSLDFTGSSGEIKQETILNLLWSGGGLLKKSNSEDQAEQENADSEDNPSEDQPKKNEVFTHPTYFTSLLDFYYINQSGLYKYDYQNNSLTQIKKGNYIDSLNLAEGLQSCILINISRDFNRLSKGIELKLKRNKKYKTLLKEVKSYHQRQKSLIKEVSYIEAGTAISNIMLMASEQGLHYHPVSVLARSKSISKKLGIKSKKSKPFIVIPLAKAKSEEGKNQKNYIKGLIESGKNAKASDFKKKGALTSEVIRQLMWAANGVISNGHAKTHPSGLPFSYIDIYYVNQKQTQLYDMASNSMKTIQFRDLRVRLGMSFRKFKTKDYLILAIKSSKNGSGLFSGKATEMININKKVLKNKKYQKALSFYQVGVALQNIRLLATDLGLSYQINNVRADDRKNIASGLSMNKGDLPVMIIPLAPK